jgi:hypothetical protein
MKLGSIYIYDPESKVNPRNEDSGSPRHKKFTEQKSSSKALVSFFREKDEMLPVDYLEMGATFAAN